MTEYFTNIMHYISCYSFFRIVAMAEEGKNYSEHDASELTLTMCRALQALHANGILHRDLKPENLLFATAAADAPIKGEKKRKFCF